MFFLISPSRRLAALLAAFFVLFHAARAQTPPASSYIFSHFAGSRGSPGSADGPAGASQFNTPRGVAADAAGNIFVADTGNRVIRKITPAGVVTTFAGKQGESASVDGAPDQARFSGPRDLAIDAAGNLYTTDFYTVRKITAQGHVTTLAGTAGQLGFVDGVGSSARFGYLYAVAPDASGNVYVSDYENDALRKITPAGVVTTLPQLVSPLGYSLGSGGAFGVAVDNDGHLLVARAAGTGVGRVTPTGVYTALDGSVPGSSTLLFAIGLSVDPAGNIYFAESSSYVVRKIAPAGVVATLAGTRGSAGFTDGTRESARFSSIEDTAVDASGYVYVADTGNDLIRKISPDGVVTTLAGSQIAETGHVDAAGDLARFYAPTHATLDAAGNLFVSDYGNRAIRKIAPSGQVTTFVGEPEIGRPEGLAFDEAGNLFVVDSGRGQILKISPDATVSVFSGTRTIYDTRLHDGLAQYANFQDPTALARSPSGTLYVFDDGAIRKVALDGRVTTIAGARDAYGSTDGVGASARFGLDVYGLVALDDANVFVADRTIIRHIDAAGRVTTLAGKPNEAASTDGIGAAARFVSARGLAADAAGNLYVADAGGSIRRMTRGGAVTTIGGTSGRVGAVDGVGADARFNVPSGIAVDSVGNLYVTDSGNHAVRKGTLNTPLPGAAPRSAAVNVGGDFNAAMSGLGPGPFTYQWRRDGGALPGEASASLSLINVQPTHAGLYDGMVTSGAFSFELAPAILGISSSAKVIGNGAEIDDDIRHPNGNWYDQVLLQGPAATITADAGQVTRISYVDLDDDIVQVEFSGAGSLTLLLKNPTEPAPPTHYHQPAVSYVKGHAAIVIVGANATTNVSVFSVGRANAINPSLFKDGVNYDGVADIAYIAIVSADGKFGGVRTANASYFADAGTTGLYAPGVEFVGPVYVGDITAFGDARPALILGAADDVSVTGGDLSQPNTRAVRVSGLSQLTFAAGTTSHGTLLPAQSNQARLEQDGEDVTFRVVVQP